MGKVNFVVGAGILIVALAAAASHAFGAEPAVLPDDPRLNKEITLKFQNAPLSEVLQYIATQSGVKIELDEKAKAQANEPVTIKQVTLKASAALDLVLQSNQLKRQNKKDKVLVLFAEGSASKQQSVVDAGPTAIMDKAKMLDLGNGVELEVVLIPPGKFKMGSPAKEERLEEAQHDVVINKPFYMGKYPVTQAQYKAIMACAPSKHKGDNLPVETVSWDDANDFCKLASQHAKCSKEPEQKWLVRLPTEAEWEYACRAGTVTEYNTGDKVSDLELAGWFNNIKGSDMCTHPVGQKKANAWGLFDMHGNVWEWSQDW